MQPKTDAKYFDSNFLTGNRLYPVDEFKAGRKVYLVELNKTTSLFFDSRVKTEE